MECAVDFFCNISEMRCVLFSVKCVVNLVLTFIIYVVYLCCKYVCYICATWDGLSYYISEMYLGWKLLYQYNVWCICIIISVGNIIDVSICILFSVTCDVNLCYCIINKYMCYNIHKMWCGFGL